MALYRGHLVLHNPTSSFFRYYPSKPLKFSSQPFLHCCRKSPPMESPPEGYRRNVGVCLMNSEKKIFTASRLDIPSAWQMPQGGIDEGEDPRVAVMRELKEETGVHSAEIIAEAPHWITYDFPPDVREKLKVRWGSDWKGQAQKWFLLKFTGKDDEINLLGDGTEKPEFGEWSWTSPGQVIEHAVDFKKPVYKEVMSAFASHLEATDIWGEIERSESYLVCSMYEEAKSLSSSILKRIFGNINVLSDEAALDDHQLHDMLESSGMVLVQSLHGLGRTVEILSELRDVFGEVAAIPVQVLLTGICLQISNDSYTGVREILEQFFSIWVHKDKHYILNDAGASTKRFHGKISLDIDEFLEVVELYTFGVLAKLSDDMGLAISWVEKAALPEEKRQVLLRRLLSLLSLKTAKNTVASSFEENSKDSSYAVANNNKSFEKNDVIESVRKLSKTHEPSSHWSSHPLSLKVGNTQFSMSRGKIAISLVGLIICYALKRKRAAFIRIIRRQMESMKKAILDFWKLAFSYQVNPLAAIQSIPSTTAFLLKFTGKDDEINLLGDGTEKPEFGEWSWTSPEQVIEHAVGFQEASVQISHVCFRFPSPVK